MFPNPHIVKLLLNARSHINTGILQQLRAVRVAVILSHFYSADIDNSSFRELTSVKQES